MNSVRWLLWGASMVGVAGGAVGAADEYLIDEGTGPAQVYDRNYHVLRRVERVGEARLEAGANRLTLATTGAGRAPWLRFQANLVGSPEMVRAQ
jgi:hypothetical protein